jgi:hypothetical protein
MARDLGRGLVGGYNASDALQNEVRLTSIVGGGNLNCNDSIRSSLTPRERYSISERPQALSAPRFPKGVHERDADSNLASVIRRCERFRLSGSTVLVSKKRDTVPFRNT